ncbi:hypothetical protein AQ948_29185, partial [Burkholderia pseudomallei]
CAMRGAGRASPSRARRYENVSKEPNTHREARAPVHRYRLQVRNMNGECRTYELRLSSLDDGYTLEIDEWLNFPDMHPGDVTPVHVSRPVQFAVPAHEFYRRRRAFRTELIESVAAALRAGEVVRMRDSPDEYPGGHAGNPWVNWIRADLRANPGGRPPPVGDDMQDLIH